jgi:hypothetical protein
VSLLPVERRLDPMGREFESPPRFRVVDFKNNHIFKPMHGRVEKVPSMSHSKLTELFENKS